MTIIHYLMKLDDISLSKATSIWRAASNFDEKVYEINIYNIVNLSYAEKK